jgi:prolyl 4-hydroxylase
VPLPSLLQSMRKAGWAEHLARRALALPEEGELPLPFAAARPEAEVQCRFMSQACLSPIC